MCAVGELQRWRARCIVGKGSVVEGLGVWLGVRESG